MTSMFAGWVVELKLASAERSGAQCGTNFQMFYFVVILLELLNRQLSENILEIKNEDISLLAASLKMAFDAWRMQLLRLSRDECRLKIEDV